MSVILDWLRSLFSGLFGQAQPAAPTEAGPADEPIILPPAGIRHINQAGLDLIKSFEGLRLEAYQDAAGVWTIGYGHTGDVPPGEVITADDAEAVLQEDLQKAEQAVYRTCFSILHLPALTDGQFACLVSFTFNLGEGALRQLLAHGLDQVPAQLPRWTHAGGQVLAGLTRRRAAELVLWESA